MTYLFIPQVLNECKPKQSQLETSVKACKKNTKWLDSDNASRHCRFLESNFKHQFDLVPTKVDFFILMMAEVRGENDWGKIKITQKKIVRWTCDDQADHSACWAFLFHEKVDVIDICCSWTSWVSSNVPWEKHQVLNSVKLLHSIQRRRKKLMRTGREFSYLRMTSECHIYSP